MFALIAGSTPAMLTGASLEEAWVKVSELSFNEAAPMFSEIAAESPDLRREANYGRAIALLNAQPATERKLNEARRLLEAVKEENAGDETGIGAWFFLARIAHAHARGAPDYAKALELYSGLGAAHPQHWYGQYALYKAATIDLTVMTPKSERLERTRHWEGRAEEFTVPLFRRNFERVLAYAYMFWDLPLEGAVAHAKVAADIGFSRNDLQTNMLIRLSLLAEKTGHRDIAIEAAQTFVREYPTHFHHQIVTDLLNSMTSEAPRQ